MSLDRFLAVVYPIRSMTWRTDCNCLIGKVLSYIIGILTEKIYFNDLYLYFIIFVLFYSAAITLTWLVTIIFCIPLFFSHSEMKTPSNNSYCDFSENQTIAFLPESWEMRWNVLAFKVNLKIIILYLRMKSYKMISTYIS